MSKFSHQVYVLSLLPYTVYTIYNIMYILSYILITFGLFSPQFGVGILLRAQESWRPTRKTLQQIPQLEKQHSKFC